MDNVQKIAEGLDADIRECVRLGFRYMTRDMFLRAEDAGVCGPDAILTPLGLQIRDHLNKESSQ